MENNANMAYAEFTADLASEAEIASSFAGKASGVSVTSNIKLTVEKDRIMLEATDGIQRFTSRISAEILAGDGSFLVPADKLTAVTKSAGLSRFVLKDGKLTIRPEGSKTRVSIRTLDSKNFPEAEPLNAAGGGNIELPSAVLRNLFASVSSCVAQSHNNRALTGMLIMSDEGALTAVGTDGHILGLTVEKDFQSEIPQVIIPRKFALLMCKMIPSDDSKIWLFVSDNKIMVSGNNRVFSTGLVQGPYVAWKRIMPKESKFDISVNRKQLLSALSMSSIMSDRASKAITLEFTKDSVNVTGQTESDGYSETSVDASSNVSEPFTMKLNGDMLSSILSLICEDIITIHIRDAQLAFQIEGENNERTAYVMMPMNKE